MLTRKFLVAAAVSLAFAAPLAADADDKAAAITLFNEGRALMASGKYAEACPKFEAAGRLMHTFGIVLNLGECLEKQGKVASAWATYEEAWAVATEKHNVEDQKLAKDREMALDARVPHVVVQFETGADVPGIEVTRDGVKVDRAALGTPTPLDPGDHVFHATAPGRQAWTSTIHVAEGVRVVVSVPSLGPATATAASTATTSTARSRDGGDVSPVGRTQRTIGYVTTVVGGVGLGVGVAYGLIARSKISDRNAVCPSLQCTPDEGARRDALTSDARGKATIANIGLAGGLVTLVGGVVLIFSAPSASAPTTGRTRVVPVVTADTKGLMIVGAW